MSDREPVLLTEAPVRVTGAAKQPLRLVQDVGPLSALDLELQMFEGANIEVRLLTSMNNASDDGWIEVDRFAPTSAATALRKSFFPLLRYVRWEVLTAAASTFLLHGVGRRQLGFLPTDVDGTILWLRADLSVTVVSGNVSAWGDRSGNGNNASQGTTADQPAYNASGWSNGLPTIDFDPANTEWMSLGSMSDSSNSYTLFAVLDQRNQATHPQDLLSARTPAVASRVFAPVTSTSAGVGIFDTAWRATGAEQNGQQILTWVLDAGASSLECFRNGTSIGSGTYVGAWLWDTPELGRLSGSTQYLDAELAELVLYNRKLAPAELAQVHSYLKSRYGL